MEADCSEFVKILLEKSEGLRKAYSEITAYWQPDEPPLTTLFGALGDRIAEDFDKSDIETNAQIFCLIESGMSSKDEMLVIAVATGLIESIITKASRNEILLKNVLEAFGKLSRTHAEAWMISNN